MTPPTSSLPNGETVASDKAASSRFLHYLDPCCYEIPKRVSRQPATGSSQTLSVEGSWLVRLLHGNPLGRWWIRWFWRSVDRDLEEYAQYQSDPKMQLLRPSNRFVDVIFLVSMTLCSLCTASSRVPPVSVLPTSLICGKQSGRRM